MGKKQVPSQGVERPFSKSPGKRKMIFANAQIKNKCPRRRLDLTGLS